MKMKLIAGMKTALLLNDRGGAVNEIAILSRGPGFIIGARVRDGELDVPGIFYLREDGLYRHSSYGKVAKDATGYVGTHIDPEAI